MNDLSENSCIAVRCRPDKSAWIVVVIVGAMGLFFSIGPILALDQPSPKPPSVLEAVVMTIIFSAIGLALLLGALWGALWILRGSIIADEDGLRWRGAREWRHATWPQVRDYYDDAPYPRHTIIETDVGQLKVSVNSMTNVAALRDAIQERASWARVGEWGAFGARESDWPRTFGYNPAEHLRDSRICSLVGLVWFCGFVWGFFELWKSWVMMWEYSSPAIVIVLIAFYLLCSLLSPLFAWMIISMLRETQARIAERITVSNSGLVFEDGARRIECAWNEISDYYRDPMLPAHSGDDRYVIVAASGTFDWTLIAGRYLLVEIIKRHAKNALYNQWRDYRPQQETGKKGERIYNYRTRDNRAAMLLPMSMILISTLMILFMPNIQNEKPEAMDDVSGTLILGFFALGFAIFYAAYFVGSIEVAEDGITQRGLRGKKFLAWQNIKQLRRTVMGNYEVIGQDTRLGFYSAIADVSILCDEISRRATNAEIAPSWTETKPH